MNTSETTPEFETLLNYIKSQRGFDFTGYKRSSLMRRVRKRMEAIKIDSFSEYLDHLEVHPEEFVHLFNTILINVTSFFRDRSAWEYVASEIVPRIAQCRQQGGQIRVWSAGCATGQEAYTLAIVLAEALGVEQYKERVKIYATDLDEEALNQARHATYSAKEVAEVPQELLEKYFDRSNRHYTFRKDLRRSVIFGRHNLVKDAPISRIDLLTCRNTLMYFNAEAQAKIIARFHFALNYSGFIFLGKAEMLLSYTKSFTPIDLKRRLFSKVPDGNIRDRSLLTGNNSDKDEINYLSKHVRLTEAAFDSSLVAQMVVDLDGVLTLANERARAIFDLNPRDLGRPLQDLEVSYRPVELRSCIEQAYAESRAIHVKDVEWTPNGDTYHFDVLVAPLLEINGGGSLLGITISFMDVTRSKRLQADFELSNQELEMAYEELQSTNEELETTNEELQSANEELETTNEELQSTNEELETMNEELQSSNQELQTLNAELDLRIEELESVNTLSKSLLNGLRSGVVVLDRNLRILTWNNEAENMWGLRADEVQSQNLINLDIGLPVEQLLQPIRTCLAASDVNYSKVEVQAINRRGRTIDCQVVCTPLIGIGQEIRGVILLMDEQGLGARG